MAGITRLACITVAVKDQDEALQWFTEKLGFQKRLDRQGPELRWLTVSPAAQPDLQLILASWFPEHVGKSPTVVLQTDDCHATYEELRERGVAFAKVPEVKFYGVEAVFKDLYENRYALVEPRTPHV